MTTNEEGDMSQVSPLLKQIPGLLALVTADGAYDGEPVCRAVAERQPHPRVAVVIPPRSAAVPSPGASMVPGQRDQHIQMIENKGGMGWQKAVGYDGGRTRRRRCSATRPSSAADFVPGPYLPRKPRPKSPARC